MPCGPRRSAEPVPDALETVSTEPFHECVQVVDGLGHGALNHLHRGRNAQVSVDAGHVVLQRGHVGGKRARHRVVHLLHRSDGHAADNRIAERAYPLHDVSLEPPLG